MSLCLLPDVVLSHLLSFVDDIFIISHYPRLCRSCQQQSTTRHYLKLKLEKVQRNLRYYHHLVIQNEEELEQWYHVDDDMDEKFQLNILQSDFYKRFTATFDIDIWFMKTRYLSVCYLLLQPKYDLALRYCLNRIAVGHGYKRIPLQTEKIRLIHEHLHNPLKSNLP